MRIVDRPYLSTQTFYNRRYDGPGNKRVACIQNQLRARGVSLLPDKVIQGALKAGLSTAEILDFFSSSDVKRIVSMLSNIPLKILEDYNKTRLIIDLGIKALGKVESVDYLFENALPECFRACPEQILNDYNKFKLIFDLGIKVVEKELDVKYLFKESLPAFFKVCPGEVVSDYRKFKMIFDLCIKAADKNMDVNGLYLRDFRDFFRACPKEVVTDYDRFRLIFDLAGEALEKDMAMHCLFNDTLPVFFKSYPEEVVSDYSKYKMIFDLGIKAVKKGVDLDFLFRFILPAFFALRDQEKIKLFFDLDIVTAEKGMGVHYLSEHPAVFFEACPETVIRDPEKNQLIFDLGIAAAQKSESVDVLYFYRCALLAFFDACPEEVVRDQEKFKLIFNLGFKVIDNGMNLFNFFIAIRTFFSTCPETVIRDREKFKLILDLGVKAAEKKTEVSSFYNSTLPAFFKTCPEAVIGDREKIKLVFDLGIKAAEKGMNIDSLYGNDLLEFFRACPEAVIRDQEKFKLIFDLGIKAVEKGMDVYSFYEIVLPEFFNACPAAVEGDNESFKKALNAIIDPLCSPALAQRIAGKLLRLKRIEFRDGGVSAATFPGWARLVLSGLPVREKTLLTDRADMNPGERKLEEHSIADIIGPKAEFVRALGRTLIYKNSSGFVAVKLQKENEPMEKIFFEYNRLIEWRKTRLESAYPEPLGVYKLNGICDNHLLEIRSQQTLKDEAITIEMDRGREYPCTALVYKIPNQNYFTYLNDPNLSEEQFLEASYRGIMDLFGLARENMIHYALIDLYHNVDRGRRHDLGRFLWMAGVVQERNRSGTGRLHSHTGAVEFPNWRLSGIADTADTALLSDLMNPQNEVSVHLRSLDRFEANASNFYLASYLGDYLLAWTIIVGDRNRKLGLLDWKDTGKVNNLARTLVSGYITAFSTFTGIPEGSVEPFLRTSINWQRLARQMHFSMTEDYVAYLKRGRVPEIIYGEEVEVAVDPNIQSSRGWTNRGWSSDGKTPDLGPVNGPFPLQELIRSLYLTTTFMVALRQRDQLVTP